MMVGELMNFDERVLKAVISIQPSSTETLSALVGEDNIEFLRSVRLLDIKATEYLHCMILGDFEVHPKVYRTTAIARPALELKRMANEFYHKEIASILAKTLDVIRKRTEEAIVNRDLLNKVVADVENEILEIAGMWGKYIVNPVNGQHIEREIIETAFTMCLERKKLLFQPTYLLKYGRFLDPSHESLGRT
mgnify:CR=1 FL=1